MRVIGIDFDNTLIKYDDIFFKTALERNLIIPSVEPSKKAIQEFLRKQNKDHEFTKLQAEVYGKGILNASQTAGSMDTIRRLKTNGHKVYIISHKTMYPIKGPKYNLRDSALKWMRKKGYFEKTGMGMNESEVYFESTKEEKVSRIMKMKCTDFIDDLKEILGMIPDSTNRILYSETQCKSDYKVLNSWKEYEKLEGLLS